MIPLNTSRHPRNNQEAGFALIASLSIMAVLVLIGVALFSLSSVATRSAEIAAARTEAQANAQTALMMAVGELQKQMGPDQRISANASILDANKDTSAIEGINHPHWLGVWDSWVAGDVANAPVNPDYPSEPSAHQTIGDAIDTDGNLKASMHPEYDRKNDHFRQWLVSLDPNNTDREDPDLAGDLNLSGEPNPGETSDSVRLVGVGSLGSDASVDEYVSAGLVGIQDSGAAPSGRYAWWVGDQSQKASILADSYDAETTLTGAERIFRTQAPAAMGTELLPGFANLTDTTQLDKLANFKTIDLLGVSPQPGTNDPKLSQLNFHHATTSSLGVLADVREGGLKRDLSTLLERPIDIGETVDASGALREEFFLYAFGDPRFNDRSHSRVPIQDLAAYYQLYDNEPNFANQRREGVQYDSSELDSAIQLSVPDFDGDSKDRQRILREYTTLYRQPVITKVQFLAAMTAEEVTPEERQWVLDRYTQAEADRAIADPSATPPVKAGPLASSKILPMRDSDTHKLRLGIMPMITLWNPNNIPLVMDDAQIMRFATPPFGYRFKKYRDNSSGGPDEVELRWTNLSYAAGNNFGGATTGQASGSSLLRLRFAGSGGDPIVFEPGEVKVFSLPATTGAKLNEDGDVVVLVSTDTNLDVTNDWDPFGFYLMPNSTPHGPYEDEAPDAYGFRIGDQQGQSMVFNPNDRITISIDAENPEQVASGSWRDGRFISMSRSSEPKGSGFALYFMDEDYQTNWRDNLDHIRHYTMVTRHGGNDSNEAAGEIASFNKDLITPGFPGGVTPIEFDDETNAVPGSQIVAAGEEVISLFEFSLNLGSEIGNSSAGGFGGGRRITSRPFLHSPVSAAPFIDQSDKVWLYNYGWDWQVGEVNAVEDSIVRAEPGTGNGYYGGGYTLEAGTTHVVQREIPVVPPISIAALSHAHLGGFSLGYAMSIGDNPETDTYFKRSADLQNPQGLEYQRTTATGQAGLGPHVVQAIGNSYAHPHIPAETAFTTKTRYFDVDEGPVNDVPFVDHSYLANKALWDEFFFSSIAPQPSKVPLFESSGRTAKEVAEDFFINGEPLPNRRIKPYLGPLEQAQVDSLFAEASEFTDGMADKIASHLMINGAFNINSTSVEAWKVFLSSLKGKPVAYLDGGISPQLATTQENPLGSGILPNAAPIETADIVSPNNPPEQWKTGRVLTDIEIEDLAKAIVYQVKLRGPFLSLSEFINRRLDEGNLALSVKGALQAALDFDPDVLTDTFGVNPPDINEVSINANFRQSGRTIDAETSSISGFEFPEAATGPIAYGSMPYMDQADMLKHFSEQLTPRGDTFIIRSYGDSMDASGKVISRAWCEAVVQRVPEYSDPTNSAHEKQDELTETNRLFGRKLKIVSFRWLDSNEV